MTVTSTANKSGPYELNGVTTTFPRTFRIGPASDMKVIRIQDGVETVLTTGFTITDTYEDTGNVIFSPALNGGELVLLRSLPLTQGTDYSDQARVAPSQVEADLDKAVMLIQDMDERLDRAAVLPVNADPADTAALVVNIQRLGDSADNIDTVANMETAIGEVAAVSGFIPDVAAVAPLIPGIPGLVELAAELAASAASGAYASRAAFLETDIPAPVVAWTIIQDGRRLDFVRDASGTAIESSNGVKGSPAGEATVLHWGASPLADPADNHAAFSAALASPFSRIVVPRMPTQYFIGGQLLVTGTSKTLAGDGLSRASLSFADTFSGPAIVFAPATRTDNVLQGNNGIENLNLDGVGSDRAGRWAIEVVKQEAFTLRNMRWGGFSYGVRYAGGQLSNFSDFYGFGSGRTAGTQLADSCHLCVESEPNTSGTKPAYTLNISNFTLSGGSSKNIQDIIRLGQADGLNISNGYVAYGFGSLLKVDPLTGASVVAVQIANTYFDGVNTSTGTESGLYVPTNLTGANISMEFTNCFLGNYTGRCINADTNNVIRSLVFNGCNLSSAAIAIGAVRGDANARIQFKGTTLRNSIGGLKVIGARTLDVDATFVDITDAAGALQLSGTISRKKIAASFIGCTLDRADTSTTTTLSDYEWIESGTFTPNVSIGGVNLASGSHSARDGQYTKIMNRVYFDIRVAITSKEAKTGEVRVTGLPFTRGGTVNPQMVCRAESGSSVTTGVNLDPGDVLSATSYIRLNKQSTNGSTVLLDTDILDTFGIRISGSYPV